MTAEGVFMPPVDPSVPERTKSMQQMTRVGSMASPNTTMRKTTDVPATVAGCNAANCGESGSVRVKGAAKTSSSADLASKKSFINSPWSKTSSEIVENHRASPSPRNGPYRPHQPRPMPPKRAKRSIFSWLSCIRSPPPENKRNRPGSSRSSVDYASVISRSRTSYDEGSPASRERRSSSMKRVGSLEDIIAARERRASSIRRNSLDSQRKAALEKSRAETGFLDRAFENASAIAFSEHSDDE